jgi:hypothetical protein
LTFPEPPSSRRYATSADASRVAVTISSLLGFSWLHLSDGLVHFEDWGGTGQPPYVQYLRALSAMRNSGPLLRFQLIDVV